MGNKSTYKLRSSSHKGGGGPVAPPDLSLKNPPRFPPIGRSRTSVSGRRKKPHWRRSAPTSPTACVPTSTSSSPSRTWATSSGRDAGRCRPFSTTAPSIGTTSGIFRPSRRLERRTHYIYVIFIFLGKSPCTWIFGQGFVFMI